MEAVISTAAAAAHRSWGRHKQASGRRDDPTPAESVGTLLAHGHTRRAALSPTGSGVVAAALKTPLGETAIWFCARVSCDTHMILRHLCI